MAYETDEQQAEALKKWWAENGKQVIGGAVIGLAAVFGWRGWQDHVDKVNGAAAEALDRMLQVVSQGEKEQGLAQGQKIVDEYAGSIYADFASLSMASLLVRKGEESGAIGHLQRVVERQSDPALTDLARLHLARLLLSQQRGAEARALLDQVAPAYLAEVETIRGDIAAAAGEHQAARDAYEKALATGKADNDLVRLKLNDLAAAH